MYHFILVLQYSTTIMVAPFKSKIWNVFCPAILKCFRTVWGGCVRKNPKLCWRNIWMVPITCSSIWPNNSVPMKEVKVWNARSVTWRKGRCWDNVATSQIVMPKLQRLSEGLTPMSDSLGSDPKILSRSSGANQRIGRYCFSCESMSTLM